MAALEVNSDAKMTGDVYRRAGDVTKSETATIDPMRLAVPSTAVKEMNFIVVVKVVFQTTKSVTVTSIVPAVPMREIVQVSTMPQKLKLNASFSSKTV